MTILGSCKLLKTAFTDISVFEGQNLHIFNTYSPQQINFLYQIIQFCMVKLSLNEKNMPFPSYFYFLFFYENMEPPFPSPDSSADLTFDPLSARVSTGTQPRSVTQHKALHSGYEGKEYLCLKDQYDLAV